MIIFRLLIMTFVILTFNNASAVKCMRLLDRLNAQIIHFTKQSRVTKEGRAGKRLEEDLWEIRNSPEEPSFIAQGFKPEHFRGSDLAREFKAVARFLKTIKADPKRTHISYFADQIGKTITDFENSFREYNKNNSEFLEERLKILEAIKAEAEKRIEDQNVTYDWWAVFNLRLSMITLESDFIRSILKLGYMRFRDPTVREKAGIEIAYNKELVQVISGILSFEENLSTPFSGRFGIYRLDLEELNPEEILFRGEYTSRKLEKILRTITDLSTSISVQDQVLKKVTEEKGLYNIDTLKTHEGMQEFLSDIVVIYNNTFDLKVDEDILIKIIGMKSFTRTKEKFPEEVMFFTTDELGIMAFNRLEDGFHFIGMSGSPLTIDGSRRNPFSFFIHDVSHIENSKTKIEMESFQKILERIENLSKSDREKAELALFIFRHEGGGSYKYELKQIKADAKEAAREMMMRQARRFFSSNDLQMLLPESVNVNNRQEVERYLTESADVFADHFSDILLTVEYLD